MNLDSLTADQRESVRHVSGPLLVSAGAGSGKTFTLTQRIAYALLEESGPAIQDIDEVLAITFTEKAAAEIKARVRSTLRQNGLFDQALKVDGAWISTIHGMCSRILRAHALELGVDPGFGILSERERDDMLTSCINEALNATNEIIGSGPYDALFDEYKARSSMASDISIELMLRTVINKASGLRGGVDAFHVGPEPAKPGSLARDLLLAYEAVMPALEQGGASASAAAARDGAAEAMARLNEFLSTPAASDDIAALAQVVEGCRFLPRNFGGAEVKEAVAAYQQEHARIDSEIVLAIAYPYAKLILEFAGDVRGRYEEKKRAACMLDNDDLLLKTLQAFEEHPEIVRHYAERFKLVMVDEFQDTNQIQIDLIAYLAGEQSGHLCTVGDSQQSIYRFRGADVGVYEAHKRTMRSENVGALCKELKKNFRSHGDVLSLVDRIFEQPTVFGDRFMSLEPDAKREAKYRSSLPRIGIVLASLPAGTKAGVGICDAKEVEARAIAERFSHMRDEGHDPGDMVVLLGKMSRADVYAQALRDAGFECVIAGGTLFDKALEVRTLARFVEVLANPRNTAALFEVLTSDMIRLTADELLELSTARDKDTGSCTRRDLYAGFSEVAQNIEQGSLQDGVSERLVHAVRLFALSRERLFDQTVSRVVLQAVLDSGWISRLQQQGAAGIAVAGNILKAIRMIEGLETQRHEGIATLAKDFSDQITMGMKESPGALSGDKGGVVKIMTIHASKGLEFPIVAVADFYDDNSKSEKLTIETKGNTAYLSLEPGESLLRYPSIADKRKKYCAPCFEEDASDRTCEGAGDRFEDIVSQAEYRAALKAHTGAEELAEARRKFYVALTRASEALLISLSVKEGRPGDALKPYKGVVEDIRSALFPNQDFPQGTASFEYGGTQPGVIKRIPVLPLEEGDVPEFVPKEFCIPVLGDDRLPALRKYSPQRAGVFSYSSISHDEEFEKDDSLWRRDGYDRETPRPDLATGLGTAFHRLAQYAIESGGRPDAQRIAAVSKALALSEAQGARLDRALDRWFSSEIYGQARGYATVRSESPFFIRIEEAYMEGEIDLLCFDDCKGMAFVVDYKTGGSDDESEGRLLEKHRLQAVCYAYACLLQGFTSVDLRFVRVEHDDPRDGGGMQTVPYAFAKEHMAGLKREILRHYHASCM